MLSTVIMEGRELALTECSLAYTYAGSPTGPTLMINQLAWKNLEREADLHSRKYLAQLPVFVMPLPTIERLPPIQVVGVFEGQPIGSPHPGDQHSTGIVGWFQNSTEKVEVEFLKGLPWEAFARNSR